MKCLRCGQEMLPINGKFLDDGCIRIYKWKCCKCDIIHDESENKI